MHTSMWEIKEPKRRKGGDFESALLWGAVLGHREMNDDIIYSYVRCSPHIPNLNFLPPGIFVDDVFVSRAVKIPDNGLHFTRVDLIGLVAIEWSDWDRSDWKTPSEIWGGERDNPDDYFTAAPPDKIIKDSGKKFWKLAFRTGFQQDNPGVMFSDLGPGYRYCVNDFGKEWISECFPGQAEFEPVPKERFA